MQPGHKRLLQQVGIFLVILALIVYGYEQMQNNGSPAPNSPARAVAPKQPQQNKVQQQRPLQGQAQQQQPGSVSPAAEKPMTGGSKQYLFIFGDSYSSHTAAGFVPTAPLVPTDDNPTGYLGAVTTENTFTGGDMWVDFFLEQTRPGTLVYSYATPGNVVNYTRLAGTFDPKLMAIMSPVKDMDMQLGYFETLHNKKVPWTGQNSIFFNFFGVNDLTATQMHSNLPDAEMDRLVQAQCYDFWDLVRQQYKYGARLFIHMLVPPMNRVPAYTEFRPDMQPMAKHLTAVWSELFRTLHADFQAEHPDVASVVFETANVFNSVMDHYAEFGADDGECFNYDKPNKKCVWWDFLHPGIPIHKEIAKGMLATVKKLPGQA